ncbi:MAG TPA: C40 family peptidase [Gemmatimonadaceae bacterium]|nr:C40 family peptidase [Gemmatimonadaceae bacterium]
MGKKARNIQCLLWVALASYAVTELDARAGSRGPRELPRVAIAALADTRQVERDDRFPEAAPFEGFEITDAMRDSIVRLARAQVGRRYRFGGTSPGLGFDCSGFVRYVLGQLHMPLPRLAAQQARVGAPVDRSDLRPGDLLSFGEKDTISHIGIYIGDGKFVHASSVAGRVIVSQLNRPASRQIRPLKGARRLLAMADERSMSF